jgi:hypothetical protein
MSSSTSGRPACAPLGCAVAQERAQQRERDPTDEARGTSTPPPPPVAPVEHERSDRERRGLHADPEQRQVMAERDQRRRREERQHAAHERPSTAGWRAASVCR